MSELSQHEFAGPSAPLTREGPEAMQAFVVRHRPFFVLVAVLIGQLLLLSLQITRNRNVRLIQVWTVAIFSPFARTLHWVDSGVGGKWRSVANLRGAEKENQELLAERDRLEARVNELGEKAAEADRLRALLDFKNGLPYTTVAAEVIAASPGEGAAAVFIGKGLDAGLTNDLAIITPSGIVGKTIAVFPHTTQVLLITDPSSGVGCYLEKSLVQGVLKGSSSSLAELHYVMNGTPVEVGEAVLTSGLDQVYPKGLPVGTVAETNAGNIYRKILVRPAAGLDRLETVLVVLKSPDRSPAKP
jgi:rod shape-determining protein MreC